MAGPRKKQLTERQDAKRGSRPDPVRLPPHYGGMNRVVNGDPRFEYHFWPEGEGVGSLGAARGDGWEVVEAEAPGTPGAVSVTGGMNGKVGEPLRGMKGQVLCRRPVEIGKRQEQYRQHWWKNDIERRLGLRQLAGEGDEDINDERYFSENAKSKTEVLGGDPYPAYQENA